MSDWVNELPAEVTVTDDKGVILELNAAAAEIFAGDGGINLVGTNMLDCHPEPSRSKLADMLEQPISNSYFSTEKGEKRFFFQSPWFREGKYAGFVEVSFPVPEEIPHFRRG